MTTSPGRQYQLVCTIKYSTVNGSYLVSWLSCLTEMGEIIRTTTEREGKYIIYDG